MITGYLIIRSDHRLTNGKKMKNSNQQPKHGHD